MPLSIDARAARAAPPALPALAVSITGACRIAGRRRGAMVRSRARGALRAVKSGRRTLILADSVRVFPASLPPAAFRSAKTRSIF